MELAKAAEQTAILFALLGFCSGVVWLGAYTRGTKLISGVVTCIFTLLVIGFALFAIWSQVA